MFSLVVEENMKALARGYIAGLRTSRWSESVCLIPVLIEEVKVPLRIPLSPKILLLLLLE